MQSISPPSGAADRATDATGRPTADRIVKQLYQVKRLGICRFVGLSVEPIEKPASQKLKDLSAGLDAALEQVAQRTRTIWQDLQGVGLRRRGN